MHKLGIKADNSSDQMRMARFKYPKSITPYGVQEEIRKQFPNLSEREYQLLFLGATAMLNLVLAFFAKRALYLWVERLKEKFQEPPKDEESHT